MIVSISFNVSNNQLIQKVVYQNLIPDLETMPTMVLANNAIKSLTCLQEFNNTDKLHGYFFEYIDLNENRTSMPLVELIEKIQDHQPMPG